MTVKEMKNIFTTEIPLKSLVYSGIYEFYFKDDKSIGICYEYVEGKLVYFFCFFLGKEHKACIDIDGEYENIYDAVEIVTEEWNKLLYG